jgi:hypothetical protein
MGSRLVDCPAIKAVPALEVVRSVSLCALPPSSFATRILAPARGGEGHGSMTAAAGALPELALHDHDEPVGTLPRDRLVGCLDHDADERLGT